MRPRLKFIHVEINRHGKAAVYFRRRSGIRIRLPALAASNFRAAYDAAMAGKPIPHVRDMPLIATEIVKQRCERAVRSGLTRAKARSRSKHLLFDLNLDWAFAQIEQQQFKCALTGIGFYSGPDKKGRHPYAPSFDRIDTRCGYVTGNVRIVLFAINAMFNDWGHEIFEQVANSYRYKKYTKREHSIPAPYSHAPAPKKIR